MVRVRLTVTPQQGVEVVFEGEARAKPDSEYSLMMSARSMVSAMDETIDWMVPPQTTCDRPNCCSVVRRARQPHQITSTYKHKGDGTFTVSYSGAEITPW